MLLALNMGLICTLGFFRILFASRFIATDHSTEVNEEPFISVHLAICNEPPSIVINTINSILNQNYQNFELVIISNNTTNSASYEPVQKFAADHKKKIKFYHLNKVKGFKAGALNIALSKTNPKSNYIFTVDADYELKPQALVIAVRSINVQNVEVLQFPQDYRNLCTSTVGLKLHYKHYFECYLFSKESQKFGLPTGTLTLINYELFKDGMRWPTSTITEDAHFGIEVLSKDFKIGFCNISVGKGTMPTTLNDYNKQLKRWVFGNFQTLVLLIKKDFNLIKKLRLLTMLSAWVNLLALPFIAMLVVMVVSLYSIESINVTLILVFSSILLHLLFQYYLLFITAKRNISDAFKALLVHIGTLEIGSFYWLLYFKNKEKPFVRTNKYIVSSAFSIGFFILPITIFFFAILSLLLGHKLIGLCFLSISVLIILGKLRLISEIFHSKFNYSRLIESSI